MNKQLLRELPKVDVLRQAPELGALRRNYGEKAVTEAVRMVVDALRQGILAGEISELPTKETLFQDVSHCARENARPSLRRVLNGTGILLHTNLGRACLSEKAARAAGEMAMSYSNLEYDLQNGTRGSRYSHVADILCRLTGAEGALVVNNNAAAVLLVLSALTAGGEVPVSRGELVEIGGSFRVPEIMEACGARLKEVGTTNKTHLSDYEKAINPDTKALMKVHTSNYRIIGFSETPPLPQLVALGHSRGLPVIEDLGSGCLAELGKYGLPGEPTIRDSLAAGVDVVTFSGDKLLGGPQAGIILGKRSYLEKLMTHPLTRALRVDKMTLAALEATLRSYEAGCETELPVLRMLAATPESLREKAQRLAGLVENARVVPVEGRVGGGSLPDKSLKSFAVALPGDANTWEKRLRLGDPAVLGRIHGGQYLLDVRTLEEADFPALAAAIREAMG